MFFLVDITIEFIKISDKKVGYNASFDLVKVRGVITFPLFVWLFNVDEYDSFFKLRIKRVDVRVVVIFDALAVDQFAVLEHIRRNGADLWMHALLFIQNEVFDLVVH